MDDHRSLTGSAPASSLAQVGLDLHDGPLQDAAFLVGHLRALRDDLLAGRSGDGLLASIEELEGVMVELEATLRALAVSLTTGDRVERPFRAELEDAIARFERRSGLRVELHAEGPLGAIPAACGDAFVHVAAEALENVRRHSGASRVRVDVRAGADGARLAVHDDGAGFEPLEHPRGLGLAGMGERMRRCGGTLELESAAGAGTTVIAALPAAPSD